MATNLLIRFNNLLELLYGSHNENINSIRRVFNRDFDCIPSVIFRGTQISPTPADGIDALDRLFNHLTTAVTDEATKKRGFESERAIRIHWIKFILELQIPNDLLVFEVPDEKRIYVLEKNEKYVIVLEPLRKVIGYYLITAYKLEPINYKKIMKKFQKRGKAL